MRPGIKKAGKVITSRLLGAEVAAWQFCKNIRNVQLSSLKHHHYAYRSFFQKGWGGAVRKGMSASADKDPSCLSRHTESPRVPCGSYRWAHRLRTVPELWERPPGGWVLSAPFGCESPSDKQGFIKQLLYMPNTCSGKFEHTTI